MFEKHYLASFVNTEKPAERTYDLKLEIITIITQLL